MKSLSRFLAVSTLLAGQFSAALGFAESTRQPEDVFAGESGTAVTLMPTGTDSRIQLTNFQGRYFAPADNFESVLELDNTTTGEPLWTARVGAIFLNRGGPRSTVMVDDGGGSPLLYSGQYDFSIPWGMEVDAIRHNINGTGWGIEGRYFGVSNFNAGTSATYQTGAEVPYINPIGATGYSPTTMNSSYETSNLLNFELNARKQVNPDLQYLVGFRYFGFNEAVGINLASDPFSYYSNHQIGASNHLYGAQIGADKRLWQHGRFQLEGIVKAGLYGNQSSNNVVAVVQDEVGSTYTSSASQTQAAFLGEVGLTGLYKLTNHLAFRATYQALWLEGIALAPNQIGSSDPLNGTGSVNNNSGVVFHGAFLGLEYTR